MDNRLVAIDSALRIYVSLVLEKNGSSLRSIYPDCIRYLLIKNFIIYEPISRYTSPDNIRLSGM